MKTGIDLTGQKFNKLTVINEVLPRISRRRYWNCICDCGNKKQIEQYHLTADKTKSCGCFRNAQISKTATTHGDSKTPLYISWLNMHARCNNIKSNGYANYGARGIKVCPEWKKYINFKSWAINSRYQKHLTIERENNDGNYTPDNCTWATRTRQGRNQRKMSTNTSGYIGVSFHKRHQKYIAYVSINKKLKYLGLFLTAIEAAKTRDKYILDKGLKHFMLNFK